MNAQPNAWAYTHPFSGPLQVSHAGVHGEWIFQLSEMTHICHWSTQETEPHDQPGSRASLAAEWDPNSKEKKNQNKSLSKPRPKLASILLSLSNQAVFSFPSQDKVSLSSHSRPQQSKLAWNSRSSSSAHQALSCRHGHKTCSKIAPKPAPKQQWPVSHNGSFLLQVCYCSLY